MTRAFPALFIAATIPVLAERAPAADANEFKVKREAVFEFAQRPQVTRQGDRATVSFETKGFCDVTVAVEDPDRKIVRHLASGVLGPNAPEPYQKNTKQQSIVWDGKNDKGEYVDDTEHLTVRVGLGLKAQFERTHYWSPHMRRGEHLQPPIISPAPEGVYVYDAAGHPYAAGSGLDHVRLFSHAGEYLRTIYPFAADRIRDVQGLAWGKWPDGLAVPVKKGYVRGTLLTSGGFAESTYSSGVGEEHHSLAVGAAAMAVREGRIALVSCALNRLGTDGSSGGLALSGPDVTVKRSDRRGKTFLVGPRSAALSPDGEWLYLTAYTDVVKPASQTERRSWLPVVFRMEYAGDQPPRVFAGGVKDDDAGTGEGKLRMPLSVACDAAGRVYVADYMNNQAQVFTADGRALKVIGVDRPTQVTIHPKSGEVFVFSWPVVSRFEMPQKPWAFLYHFGPVTEAGLMARYDLPILQDGNFTFNPGGGLEFRAEVDGHADPPTVWLVPGMPGGTSQRSGVGWGTAGYQFSKNTWESVSIKILAPRNGKLERVRDFGKDALAAVLTDRPPHMGYQRLWVNPADRRLYVGEGRWDGVGHVEKLFEHLTAIDPETKKISRVDLPMAAMDGCFDRDGRFYLQSETAVVRLDSPGGREAPWDYGEELKALGYGMTGKSGSFVAGLRFRNGGWWPGGIHVSVRGRLAMAFPVGAGMGYTDNTVQTEELRERERRVEQSVGPKAGSEMPKLYPGRPHSGSGCLVRIWDEHGRVAYEDAAPGLAHTSGVAIDREDNVYVLTSDSRLNDDFAGLAKGGTRTLIKFRAGKARILARKGAPVPLDEQDAPKRPFDLPGTADIQGKWGEGADWYYGGIGYHIDRYGCECWVNQFALDEFARSFAPETGRHSVAVLDTNGNLIMHIGRYGNVDDGRPLVLDAGPGVVVRTEALPTAGTVDRSRPSDALPHPLGADETGLLHPAFVTADTDRRIFIADLGNARIVSVKLDYHAAERVALKDVKETK